MMSTFNALLNFIPAYCPFCGKSLDAALLSNEDANRAYSAGEPFTHDCGNPTMDISIRYSRETYMMPQAATEFMEREEKFLAACAGREFPDVTRLDWLQALITDYTERCPGPHEDPDAVFGMLAECRGLLADLRAAVLKAGGGQP